ncbi:CHAP domain-containing protein [Acidisphaera sp. L21]|uniref:CHAP domain-containing protein n=1 Tax=Acidisphaera sp. L21 TaxID=1641851 RepID=UPI0020B14841|nr:CHAP domain-containing protein [Acidisphaera sp. L21]
MTGGSRSANVECAPFAREVSGIQLYGDAASWWDSASGRYQRTAEPGPGEVLVFRRSGRLPSGHVSVVSRLKSAREIIVTQANWVHGRIARSEPVIDVSPGNDWTAVRVWWEPSNALGTTIYPTFGFIAPRPPARSDVVAAN